jgi:hypothetical protein
MKKIFLLGLISLVLLSGCSTNKDTGYTDVVPIQIENTGNDINMSEESTSDIQQTSPSEMNEFEQSTVTEEISEIEAQTEMTQILEIFQNDVKDDELENLIGEYDYLSDNGTGRLIISKTSYGYDISDYESEASYRFLADSSNIDTIENNRIYIKYPEQVFSDDTVIFSYYILEYGTNEINVYYKKDVHGEEQFLYCATKN